jgi:predicted transcriptional regulator
MKRRILNKEPKEEIIDLTDTGNHNTMPVIRELEQDPVTGLVTMRSITDPKRNSAFDNDSPVQIVTEDKGTVYHEPDTPPIQTVTLKKG